MTETFPKGWRLGGKQLMSDLLRQSGVTSLHFFDNLTNSGACGDSPSGIMHWFAPSSLVKNDLATTETLSYVRPPPKKSRIIPISICQASPSKIRCPSSCKRQLWKQTADNPLKVSTYFAAKASASVSFTKNMAFQSMRCTTLHLHIIYNICIYLWQHATNKFINTSQPRASSQATASFSSNTSQ